MLPPMLHTAQKLTLFYIVGNAITSGQLLFINKKKYAGGGKLFLGRENSRATPPSV